MGAEPAAARLHPLHRAWRILPRDIRRSVLLQGSAWLAPVPDRPPPRAAVGIGVGGELDKASGLGEAARLTLKALQALGIPCWPVRAGAELPPGAPLILHVNPPALPLELIRLGRGLVHGRRIIGFW